MANRNDSYAKFCRVNKVHYGQCENGEFLYPYKYEWIDRQNAKLSGSTQRDDRFLSIEFRQIEKPLSDLNGYKPNFCNRGNL